MTIPPQKVSLYSTSELKNATDDALALYLSTLPKPYTFQQKHFTANVRLALGYTAVIVAGVLFYADWKLGWDITKPYTLPACVAYFLLNGALTYWVWAVEAGTVFVGVREGGQKLTLKSSVKKHDPIYRLKVRYEARSGKGWQDEEITGKFTEWFNSHGYLQKAELHRWLAKNIEVVELADLATTQSGEKKYEEALNDTITVSSGAEVAEAVPKTPAKRGRPKKKA